MAIYPASNALSRIATVLDGLSKLTRRESGCQRAETILDGLIETSLGSPSRCDGTNPLARAVTERTAFESIAVVSVTVSCQENHRDDGMPAPPRNAIFKTIDSFFANCELFGFVRSFLDAPVGLDIANCEKPIEFSPEGTQTCGAAMVQVTRPRRSSEQRSSRHGGLFFRHELDQNTTGRFVRCSSRLIPVHQNLSFFRPPLRNAPIPKQPRLS